MRRGVIVLTLALLTMTAGEVYGQRSGETMSKSHLGVGVGFGVGTLEFRPVAENRLGPMVEVGGEYTHFVADYFGFKVGVGFSYTSSSLDEGNVKTLTSREIEGVGNDGSQSLTATYLCMTPIAKEHYRLAYAEIPIMLVLQGKGLDFSIKSFRTCFFAAGVKMALPLSCQAETDYSYTKMSIVAMSGNGDGTTTMLDEAMPMESFIPPDDTYSVKEAGNPTYLMASVEGGGMMNFNGGGTLQLSLFLDYAINYTSTHSNAVEIISTEKGDFKSTGFLNSSRVDRFKFFKIGLRLQYNFNW